MKKIITLFVFVFLFSQLSLAQQATLLENSSHEASAGYYNRCWGTDENHSFYWHPANSGSFFIVSDKNGNCTQYEKFVAEVNGKTDKFPNLAYVLFNRKSYIIYWANIGSNKWKEYAMEWPEDGKLIPEKSIELAEAVFLVSIKIAINHDSTEIAIGYNVFNTSFEKIKEAQFDFSAVKEKNTSVRN